MSKVDAQRAMREAKYARNNASGPTRREAAAAEGPTAPSAGQQPAKPAKPAKAAKAAPVEKSAAAAPTEARCGHRSMNGRECTREANHPEKNHRYG
jgi:hypothetical protein